MNIGNEIFFWPEFLLMHAVCSVDALIKSNDSTDKVFHMVQFNEFGGLKFSQWKVGW
jgi:hypothetical protein